VGKDALVDRLIERGGFARPVTMTTREPRPDEVDGQDYIFTTEQAFRRYLAAGELLEHAEIYGKGLYGVPREQLRRALATGQDVVVRIDVQGVASLQRLIPDAVFVMLVPDDLKNLEKHLRARAEYSHDEADIQRRLAEAEQEMARGDRFDHVVVNVEGDLDATVAAVLAIAAAERADPERKPVIV
jgi:guanylate kinase